MIESQCALILKLEQAAEGEPKVLKSIRLEVPGAQILEATGDVVSDLSFLLRVAITEIVDRGTGTGTVLAGLDYTQAGS